MATVSSFVVLKTAAHSIEFSRTTGHAYVDHILYFAEAGNRYNIPLIPICSYISSLAVLCGTSDRSRLCNKISLVHTAAAIDVPTAWAFLETNGSRRFVFEGVQSALNILQEVAVQRNPEQPV